MSLLKCTECGGMVSSKAVACPHCGCPIESDQLTANVCSINGIPVDMTSILQIIQNDPRDKIIAIGEFRKLTGCGVASAKDFVEKVCRTGKIPEAVSVPDATISNARCPTCGSTNIETINLSTRAAATVLFGVVSKTARSQFRCRSCGYKW